MLITAQLSKHTSFERLNRKAQEFFKVFEEEKVVSVVKYFLIILVVPFPISTVEEDVILTLLVSKYI